MANTLQILASQRRADILRLVWHHERAAGDIAAHFDVTFGAVSQHLALLREAGLLEVRRDGTRRFYRARRAALGPLAEYLEGVWRDQLLHLKDLAEKEEHDDGDD